MFSSCRVYGASSQIQHDLGCFKYYYYWLYIYILAKAWFHRLFLRGGPLCFVFVLERGHNFIEKSGEQVGVFTFHYGIYILLFLFLSKDRACCSLVFDVMVHISISGEVLVNNWRSLSSHLYD